MKIQYRSTSLSASSLGIVATANAIISEYVALGYRLTLRQLYYQFVSRDLIANRQSEYKRLGSIVNDGRLCGLIDWNAIEDRGRNLRKMPHWKEPADIVAAAVEQYKIDLWSDQMFRPEVWIEKEALAGVIAPICDRLRIPYFACKGYVSQSEMWEAGANRLAGHVIKGQSPIVLHFGDHDPSGIDMTRDISERLTLFAGARIRVERLALNADQIEEYGPPPNPAKQTDARFSSYVRYHGSSSWELDALDPRVLVSVIEGRVDSLIDSKRWKARLATEGHERESLRRIAECFPEVDTYLRMQPGKRGKKKRGHAQ